MPRSSHPRCLFDKKIFLPPFSLNFRCFPDFFFLNTAHDFVLLHAICQDFYATPMFDGSVHSVNVTPNSQDISRLKISIPSRLPIGIPAIHKIWRWGSNISRRGGRIGVSPFPSGIYMGVSGMATISYGYGFPFSLAKNPPRAHRSTFKSGRFSFSVSRQKRKSQMQSSCRCSRQENQDLGYDLYDLLGVDSAAEQQQIRRAYRWLQKKCHPDIAGPDGHDMAILLNHAYSVLSDPYARSAYDQARADSAQMKGYTGQPLYSQWYGTASEERAVFVDEVKCVGCLKCALVAPNTFAIETVYGRARAVGQWADSHDTIDDAVRACPVDCISWVNRSSLPALEFIMSKQPRVAVRNNTNNNGGATVANVFVDAERFLQKYRLHEEKASNFQESPAQREARMAAAEQIRASAGWWWHHFVGKKATEDTDYKRASKGAIVHLNWEKTRRSTSPSNSYKDNSGSDKYPRIDISQELSEAAARRRRRNASPFTSKPREVIRHEEYWVPIRVDESSGSPSSANDPQPSRFSSTFKTEGYSVLSGDEDKGTSRRQAEEQINGGWRKRVLSGLPLVTSAVAAFVVGFGSGSGEAGGLQTHVAGPLALEVTNSFALQVFLAASFWYIVGTVLASVTAALAFARKKP